MSRRIRQQTELFLRPSARTFRSSGEWIGWLNEELPPPTVGDNAPTVIDLFAGCGGLALGFEAAGMDTRGYEMKLPAVESYNCNLHGVCEATTLAVGEPEGYADVVIGGPPCQPFSQIGYQRGKRDKRDGFPIFLDAVNRIRPRIAIIENVRGLLFRNKDYLRQATEELVRFGYDVDVRLLNANAYGVPQNRERVVIVGSRIGWEWPDPVVTEPVTAGIALGTLIREITTDTKFLTESMDRYVAKYEKASHCIRPRDLHLDQASRTVTCRNLGGATADMLRIALDDGRRRMLHVREGARLQSFPDWFKFSGTHYEAMEQIGNAVPPLLGLAIARQVKKALESPRMAKRTRSADSALEITPKVERISQALTLLREAGVPLRGLTERSQERLALCLLGVAHIGLETPWTDAKSYFDDPSVKAFRTREILEFRNLHYGEGMSPGSYDDVRRKDLAALIAAGLVAGSARDVAADINDGTRGYALTVEGAELVRSFRTDRWEEVLVRFRASQPAIKDRLAKARQFSLIPVTLPGGRVVELSAGPHNAIQKHVIEQFLPRFSRGATVLYLGDADNKTLARSDSGLQAINISFPERGSKLPDIVAYEADRNWVFIIEAVHTSNPMSEARYTDLTALTDGTTAGRIFVSAFLTRSDFAHWMRKIAWETEVWIADEPDHVIHFDGERFLGPYR